MKRFRQFTLGAACVLLAATSLVACTLSFDFTECKTDTDCQALESDGTFYMCSAEQCVPDTALECRTAADCEAGETCSTGQCVGGSNNIATDMGGMDTGGGDPDMGPADMGPIDTDGDGVPDADDNCPMIANEDQANIDMDEFGDACDSDIRTPCDDNTSCGGDTDACVAGFCTELTSEDCEVVLGEPNAADTVTIGVILPMTAPYENIGPPLAKAVELALIEANRAGGLPNGQRLAAVVCNDVGNTSLAQRAALHLVQTLQVPAIIGPLFSTPFTDVVSQITRPAGVMTITPAGTAPSLSTLADDGLAFRMLPSDVHQAKAIAQRVLELQDVAPGGVTIFVKDDAYGNGLFNELSRELGAFLGPMQRTSVKYDDPATFGFDLAQIQAEFAEKIGTAIGSAGNKEIAIFLGTSEVVNLALGFSGALIQGGSPPARLLFSHGAVSDMPAIAADATLGATLNPLTEAVGQNIFNGINYANYNARFALEFPGEPNLTISTIMYDATAVMLFAAAAIPSGSPITGAAMAANVAKIVDKAAGTEVAAGDANFLSEGFQLLAQGDSFDFVGASGDVDFDANGDVLADFLGFINVPAMPSGWQIAPYRVFPLALGFWIDQCGGALPACGTGFTCEPSNGICLPQCNQADPMCPHPALTCVEDGDLNGVGICVPPS